jgi:hypothetical protein
MYGLMPMLGAKQVEAGGGGPAVGDGMLNETGTTDFILLESGATDFLLLE